MKTKLSILLKKYRNNALFTLKELAHLLNEQGYAIDHRTVNKYETGGRVPPEPYCQTFGHVLCLTKQEIEDLLQVRRDVKRHHRDVDLKDMPNISQFYGRERYINNLLNSVNKKRLIFLSGMEGVGKSVLIAKVVDKIKHKFYFVIWKSVQKSNSIDAVLKECIRFFSNYQATDLPETIEHLITCFLEYVVQYQCLIILDDFKLSDDEKSLLIRFMQLRHDSCLVIISQKQLETIAFLEDSKGKLDEHHVLPGANLSIIQQLLADEKLQATDEEWQRLVEIYSGNLFFLKMISRYINKLFDRKISVFLENKEFVINEVNKPLKDLFDQFSPLQQSILLWLAIEREPISWAMLTENLVEPGGSRIIAMQDLQNYHWVQIKNDKYSLISVVQEHLTQRLVEQAFEEIKTGQLSILHEHALMKASSKSYARNTQIQFIIDPLAKMLRVEYGTKGTSKRLKMLLGFLRQTQGDRPGYAPGNILNLLIYMKFDLNGCDFSDLFISEAYLSTTKLYNTNFSGVNFSKSTFMNLFSMVITTCFHPTGDLIAFGCTNSHIYVWRLADNTLLHPLYVLSGHTDWVRSVTFSHDGKKVASCSGDRTIRLWHVESGKCLALFEGHQDSVWQIKFTRDDRYLASVSTDGSLFLWDVNTGQKRVLETYNRPLRTVAISHDNSLLAYAGDEKIIYVWHIETGKCIYELRGHTEWVYSITFHPSDKYLASGSRDKTICLWDMTTGNLVHVLEGHSEHVRCVTYSPDGKMLASADVDGLIYLWDTDNYPQKKVLSGHKRKIRSISFRSDSKCLVSGGGDMTLRLWNTQTTNCLDTLRGYWNLAWSIAFNPNGTMLISGNIEVVYLWDVKNGQCLQEFHGHIRRVRSVHFHPNGQIFASGSSDGTIRVWNINTSQSLLTLEGHDSRVWTVFFSPDGKFLASGGGDGMIKLWDVVTGECFHTFRGHEDRVRSVTVSPDSQLIASGSNDETIRLWNVLSKSCIDILGGHKQSVRSVAFSADKKLLVSGSSDETVKIWDLQSLTCIKTLTGHKDSIRSVRFSPDSHFVISCGDDQTIRIWDVKTGKQVKCMQEHTGLVRSIRPSSKGELLASCSDDGTIKLWDFATGICLRTIIFEAPYQGMNINDVTGLTSAQRKNLKKLGAVEQVNQLQTPDLFYYCEGI